MQRILRGAPVHHFIRRAESEEIIKARLEKGKSEMNKVSNYKYIVLNDHVNKASNEICRIIREEIAENYRKK